MGTSGYCANNPTLYAIADAVVALKKTHADIRVVGVGIYPEPPPQTFKMWFAKHYIQSVQLLQKTLADKFTEIVQADFNRGVIPFTRNK